MYAFLRPLVAVSVTTALLHTPINHHRDSSGSPAAVRTQPLTFHERKTAPTALVRYVRGETPEQAQSLQARLTAARGTGINSGIDIAGEYGPCVLKPGVVYLRKEYQYKAVGAKPLTLCTVPVSRISHRTELRYHWYNWWLQAGATITGSHELQRTYRSKKIHVACAGREPTVWSGTTLGTVLYRGHTYYARVYQEAKELRCGALWP